MERCSKYWVKNTTQKGQFPIQVWNITKTNFSARVFMKFDKVREHYCSSLKIWRTVNEPDIEDKNWEAAVK